MQQLILHQYCFLRTKAIDIPENLSNQIVLKVLTCELQQSSHIHFLLRSLQDMCSKENPIFDNTQRENLQQIYSLRGKVFTIKKIIFKSNNRAFAFKK